MSWISGRINGVGNVMRCVMKPWTRSIWDERFISLEPINFEGEWEKMLIRMVWVGLIKIWFKDRINYCRCITCDDEVS